MHSNELIFSKRLSVNFIESFWIYFDSTHAALNYDTAQKMKFSIKDFFIKCDQTRRKLRIWSHLLKKYFMESFIFCAVRNWLVVNWELSRYSVFWKSFLFLSFQRYFWKVSTIQVLLVDGKTKKISWFWRFSLKFLRTPFLQNTYGRLLV